MRNILLKAADIMESRIDELAGYVSQETGMADQLAKSFMVITAVEMMRDVAGRATGIVGAIPETTMPGTEALVFKEPFGVVVGIAPWNAPFILGLRSVLYALATRNTAVLKGSELSPRCYWAYGDIFSKAGLPEGVLSVLYHRPEDAVAVTNALIEHPAVKKLNFTGSTGVGSIIAAKAGKELKPVLMELGGKASAIVCADAELENAAFQCALGALIHSGQICMSTERILVAKEILEPFSEKLKGAVEKIWPSSGDGPILVAKPAVEKKQEAHRRCTVKGCYTTARRSRYRDVREQQVPHASFRRHRAQEGHGPVLHGELWSECQLDSIRV